MYERVAATYDERRPKRFGAQAVRFAGRCLPGLPVLDAGCGPGSYLDDLPRPTVGLDAASAMLCLARAHAPDALLVRGDLEALPVRDRSLGGAWARNSYLHVARTRLPLALARLHWALAPGAPLMLSVLQGDGESLSTDDIPGRHFSAWPRAAIEAVVAGAGFDVDSVEQLGDTLWVWASRMRSLPDTVGLGMRVLVCGLNPSEVAADAGVPFVRGSNRFWKAAIAGGLVTDARDPLHAFNAHGVGMTDLVKRATVRSSSITADEYRAGAARVRRLVEWLQPGAVLFVGLEGWRTAIDRTAVAGPQSQRFGDAAAYVMPSTSGINAHARFDDLVDHMRAAIQLADDS